MTSHLDDDPIALAHATRTLMRRRAFKRAHDNSKFPDHEAVEFAPLMECRTCLDPLYTESRSPVPGLCRYCLNAQVDESLQRHQEKVRAVESATEEHAARSLAKTFWTAFAWSLALVLIVGFGPKLVWMLGDVIWKMAGGQ